MIKLGGKEVVIKFNEDLIGEIGVNEHLAFKLLGNETYYHGGNLIPKIYPIGNIKKYPISRPILFNNFNKGVVQDTEVVSNSLQLGVKENE